MNTSNDMIHGAPRRGWMAPLALALALAVAAPAGAGDIKYYKDGQVPSAEEVNNLLNPKKVRTRAIVIGDQAQQPQPEAATAFAFPIRFGFNSADIQDDARSYLDSVGKALQMEGNAAMRIVVEGHTDAKGRDDYNLDLSVRRANAVKDYLTKTYSIDPARVTAVGKGESEPYNTANPESAENRRVQFRRDS